jgi:hypothetical protein
MESDEATTIFDPADVEWAASQREHVVEYLASQNVDHAGVSMESRWFLRPYVAIWAVRSKRVRRSRRPQARRASSENKLGTGR